MCTDRELLADDLAAREAALDVTRSFIVQAPAGSGKTELLIQRYLKLLAAVAEPEQVLAITFTRKAAAEMRQRVVEALLRSEQGSEADEPHRRLTANLARAVVRRSAAQGWHLLAYPGRLRIQTLDSLCSQIARRRPLTAAVGAAGARILSDVELRSSYREAGLAMLDWLDEDGEVAAATRTVLDHLDNNTMLFSSYIEAMLRSRDQWLPFVGSGELSPDDAAGLRRELERNLRNTLIEQQSATRTALLPYDDIAPLFAYAADNLRRDGVEGTPILALAGVTELPACGLTEHAMWQAIAELLTTRGKPTAFRRSLDKRVGFPPAGKQQKQHMLAMLEAMSNDTGLLDCMARLRNLPPPTYTDAQWNVLLALLRLLPVAVAELRRLFADKRASDYTQVSQSAEEALGHAGSPGDVALLMDAQLEHVLVDEMQDTSIAQYRLLERLLEGWQPGDGRSLFCVGDPMQSIYRFRNAEVSRFIEARAGGIGSVPLEPLTLSQNFRSGAGLVAWFNRVFPGVLAAKDDPAVGAVVYSPASSAEQLDGFGDVRVHPLIGDDRSSEAAQAVDAIREIQARHPDDEIAVLVRSRPHLAELIEALQRAGIGYSALDIDRLTDLPEIIDVLALTRLAVHPGDRTAWLGVLRAPWIGLDWQDLHALCHSDNRSTIRELIGSSVRLAAVSDAGRAALTRAVRVLDALTAADIGGSLHRRVERCWLQLGGPALLASDAAVDNVYRFFNLIARYEECGTLRDSAELESILDQERVATRAESKLHIMTMHKAKGLQFDHVILYGLGRRTASNKAGVLSWLDRRGANGRAERIVGPIAARADSDRDGIQNYIAFIEAERLQHETARLLYVACTRAKKTLHLIGHAVLDERSGNLRVPAKGSLLARLWPVLAADFEATLGTAEEAVPGLETPEFRLPERRHFTSAWSLPDVVRPNHLERRPASSDATVPVSFDWVGGDARIAGTLVHRWLERLAGDFDKESGRSADERRRVGARWLREQGLPEDAQPAVLDRVERAVANALADVTGRKILSGDGHAELALAGVYDGRLVSVVLDRIWIEVGVHWVIDYKTGAHEGGSLDDFVRDESVRYRPQLRRYQTLYQNWSGHEARCALYFPLLQRFVEIAA